MATIRDIAKKANVAVSTVSYVLNNTKKVKPETRERILEVIKELDYHPRSVARSLKTRKTMTIGVVLPDITNLFYAETIRGIEDAANQYGYNIILCNTDMDSKKEMNYLNTLYSKDVDGVIFLGSCFNYQLVRSKPDTPIIFINSKIGDNFSSVSINDVKGGYIATKHLLERKKSDVIFFTGPLSRSWFFERMTGYIDALKSEGHRYNELLVQECDVSFKGGYDKAHAFFSQNTEIRSLFAVSDVIALGVIRALKEIGLRVPEDISVVGYDDISISEMFIPALTTVRQPKYMMGQKAVDLLMRKIKDNIVENEIFIVEPELIIRESS